jgi:Tfp pilus assembly protein PilV
MFKNFLHKKGFIAIEALLAVSVLVMFFVAFIGVAVFNRQSYENSSDRATAITLAEEGVEAVRNIRDSDFTLLSSGSYGLIEQNNKWGLSGSFDVTGKFTRRIEISSVSADKLKVTVSVDWNEMGNKKNFSLVSYLTNWK